MDRRKPFLVVSLRILGIVLLGACNNADSPPGDSRKGGDDGSVPDGKQICSGDDEGAAACESWSCGYDSKGVYTCTQTAISSLSDPGQPQPMRVTQTALVESPEA
jgi:hypothetical protein